MKQCNSSPRKKVCTLLGPIYTHKGKSSVLTKTSVKNLTLFEEKTCMCEMLRQGKTAEKIQLLR